MSGIGIRAMDLVVIALAQRTGQPFWLFKAISELTCCWSSGGPLAGRLASARCSSWSSSASLIQPVMTLNGRLVGLPNYALPDPRLASGRIADQAA